MPDDRVVRAAEYRDVPPWLELAGSVEPLLFSPARADRREWRIGWLAVDPASQRCGVGTALVRSVLATLPSGAIVSVVTFGADEEAGRPARRFYENLLFTPAEAAEDVDGGSRQVYRRALQ